MSILRTIVMILVFSSKAFAGIWSDHVVKSVEDGFDLTGIGIIAAGVGAVALVQPNDQSIKDSFGGNKVWSHDQTRPGDYIGMGLVGIPVALGQLAFDSENGYAHAEALIASFITTSALKYANNRPRPNGLNRNSMPSGHTSTTFTTATSLSMAYGWTIAIPAYLMAVYVAMTRVADDAHWASDTVAGATIGIFWGRATAFHHAGGAFGRLEPWWEPGEVHGLKWVKRF